MRDQQQRWAWMDNLRAFATFSVVLLHASVPLLDKFDRSQAIYKAWWTGNIYDSLVRFCVPVFLMLSGALLLGSNDGLVPFLKKRFTRILLPFFFWSFIYMLFRFNFNAPPPLAEVAHWVYRQLMFGVDYHMWYVYMLIGVYLVLPVLRVWIKNSTEKEMLYFLGLWLFAMIIRLPVCSFFQLNIDLAMFAGYIGYPVLGYYLSVKQFPRTRFTGTLLFMGGTTVTIIGTYLGTVKTGNFDSSFYDYLSLNVMAAATGIFLLFQGSSSLPQRKVNMIVGLLSRHSYGVYLLHLLVLGYLHQANINAYFIDPVIGVPFTAVFCLCVSLIVVWVVSKLPYGSYVSG